MKYVVALERERNSSDVSRIGIITADFPGHFPTYREGDVVLFHDDCTPEGGTSKTYTVERPLTREQISDRRKRGSRITTIGTTVWVPKNYVDEVLFN